MIEQHHSYSIPNSKPLKDVQQKPQNMKHSTNKMELRPVQPNISLSSDDLMETVLATANDIETCNETLAQQKFKYFHGYL